jgi:biotin carboxyl carrier protein
MKNTSKTQAKIAGKKIAWGMVNEVDANATPAAAPWSFDLRPGGWVIATRTMNGIPERIRFFYERSRKQFWAKAHGIDFYGERLEGATQSAAGSGAADFTAQFPGKVRKILVANGTVVETNTAILMVEAMKMEFAIKAPCAGTVKQVLVQEGQQLTPGQNLVDFVAAEPKK